jgi:ATP-dependent phosphofructokinase / diphosphate-dependent phosphofructokinase
MPRNVLVAQSGGPSPVINASLQGVIDFVRSYPDRFGRIYAGRHGIEGVLLEELIDLSTVPDEEIARLRNTPSAGAIGTCRYKLKEDAAEDFNRIIDVFSAHDIGYFFYIGGNDSMDTANKVGALAAERGVELVVVGIPKTIDNDIGDEEFRVIDHTPGYGSAARYWASITQIVDEENRGMCVSEPVSVLQAMGRKAGFIPAAARLADPERRMPLQIYLAETDHTLASLTENVREELGRSGRCIVVVSEGFDVGSLGEAHDGFGHIEYGASRTTVAQVIINHLNDVGLGVRGQATGQVPGVLQRSTSIFASAVDIEEAYRVAGHAVEIAVSGAHGYMATILRESGGEYRARYDRVPLQAVANSQRCLPASWIAPGGIDVTDDFIAYALPLIGNRWPDTAVEAGLQRFARFDTGIVEKRLASYVPVRFR